MPGMGGPELAGRLLALRPEMCVLYISGYSEQALPSEVHEADRTAFVQKPFGSVALLGTLRRLLDAAHAQLPQRRVY